jgi:DMSO/TMAO reductase YedYZ molybdopterin-dependent catalytic subunit
MVDQEMSRRTLLKGGGTAVAGLTALQVAGPAHAFPGDPGDEVIPWLDQPAPNPVPEVAQRQLVWEQLDSWITPADEFFIISHTAIPRLIRPPTV